MVLAALVGLEEEPVDSSNYELELEEEEPLTNKTTKRKKTTMVHASPLNLWRPPPPAMACNQRTLIWVPGHYMPL